MSVALCCVLEVVLCYCCMLLLLLLLLFLFMFSLFRFLHVQSNKHIYTHKKRTYKASRDT